MLKFLEGLQTAGQRDRPGARRARTSSTAASGGAWPSCQRPVRPDRLPARARPACATTATSRTSSRSTTAARPSPDLKGDLELFDVETGTIRKVTVTERNLRQYRKIFATFLESVQRYCNTYGIGGTLASTEIPFDELLLQMMRAAGALA